MPDQAQAPAAAQADAVQTPEPDCPNCQGSGEITAMTSHLGPDDYEFQDTCDHCGGQGTLAAGYAGAVKLLEKKEADYMKACGTLWAAAHIRDVAAWRFRVGEGPWTYTDDRDVLLARSREAETECLYPPLKWSELPEDKVRAAVEKATYPQPAQQAAALIAQVCGEVAELPDRSSPEDWPEAMLVTHEELKAILSGALSAAPALPQDAGPGI